MYKENCIIGYLNINSLEHKIIEFEDVFTNGLIDVLSFAETKLNDIHFSTEFEINGYRMYRKDRDYNSGGGLITYVKSNIPSKRMESYESNNFENIAIEITIQGEKWLILSIYRPESIQLNTFISNMEMCLEQILKSYHNVILIGDFNTNFLKDCFEKRQMLAFCEGFDLNNLIIDPTCFKKGCNESLIDLILVNSAERHIHSGALDNGISDMHRFIFTVLDRVIDIPKPPMITYRSYKKYDEDHFLFDLQQMSSEHMKNQSASLSQFVNEYRQICDRHAPLKTKVLKKKQVPQMNATLRKAIYKKSMLLHKWTKYKSDINFEAYRKQRNYTTKLIRESIGPYFVARCNSKSKTSSRFWTTVRPFMGKKGSKVSDNAISLEENGVLINNTKDVCNIFNEHYTSEEGFPISGHDEEEHFKRSLMKIRDMNHEQISSPFQFREVGSEYIQKKIKQLKKKKATGHDGIPPRLLQVAHQEIREPVTKYINEMICNSNFPEEFKYANICPAYKKKNRLQKDNYRPISILTSLSKKIEGAIADQMGDSFASILSDYLSAFRKGYSCQSVLMNMVEDWKLALDSGNIVYALIIDLSKAFDTLPHDKFISKLKVYGFGDSALMLMSSYLTGRKQ
jgi:hypothetical protein